MVSLLRLLPQILWLAVAVAGRQLRPSASSKLSPVPKGYTFESFLKDFSQRSGVPIHGSSEYIRREGLFAQALVEVHATNKENARRGHLWVAGIHPFMDWTKEEKLSLHGYRPGAGRKHLKGLRKLSALQERTNLSHWSTQTWLDSGVETWTDSDSDEASIRNQGHCGSCWAIAASEAVEAQLRRGPRPRTGYAQVSAQALVDCVPNPQHCGGDGGCHGATSELAFQFIRDHGIPLEEEYPYTSAETRKASKCPMSQDGASINSMYPMTRRAKVSGWDVLPSNQGDPLKQAVYNKGPTVVAVDARGWHNYRAGIFDSCEKDAVLGHAVLAVGYGDDSGNKYWRIQNSWGAGWGEDGHIRVLRPENEDNWCGTDRKPQEGVGCDGGPDEVTVCGMCGILYDGSVPQGAYIEESSTSPAPAVDGTQHAYTPWSPDTPLEVSAPSAVNTDATTKLYTPWTPDDAPANNAPEAPSRTSEFSLSNALERTSSSQDASRAPQDASFPAKSSAHTPALSLATDTIDTSLDGQATVDSVRRFLMENEQ